MTRTPIDTTAPATRPAATHPAATGTARRAGLRTLVRRAGDHTLWAFNPPAHLGGRRLS